MLYLGSINLSSVVEQLRQQQGETTAAATNNNNYNDPNFDRKLYLITAGGLPFVKEHLLTKITRDNCQTIIAYIIALQTEISPSEKYRIDLVVKLKRFAQFHNPKSFKDFTRQDVIDYLDRLRILQSVFR